MSTTDFTKEHKATVSGHFRLGAQWDVSARGKSGFVGRLSRRAGGDLDALAILCQGKDPVRMAGIGNNDPMKDGSVLHSGDNTTGKGEGDDETIDLHLDRIRPSITSVVLTVAAFKSANKAMDDAFHTSGFGGVENVTFNFYDMESATPEVPIMDIMPSLVGAENVCLVTKLVRVGSSSEWDMTRLDRMVKVTHGDQNALLRSALAVL